VAAAAGIPSAVCGACRVHGWVSRSAVAASRPWCALAGVQPGEVGVDLCSREDRAVDRATGIREGESLGALAARGRAGRDLGRSEEALGGRGGGDRRRCPGVPGRPGIGPRNASSRWSPTPLGPIRDPGREHGWPPARGARKKKQIAWRKGKTAFPLAGPGARVLI